MFALRKNKTDFNGRPLRIFPSSETPRKGIVSKTSHNRIVRSMFLMMHRIKIEPSSAK